MNTCGAWVFTTFYRLGWDRSNIIINNDTVTSWTCYCAGTLCHLQLYEHSVSNINLF